MPVHIHPSCTEPANHLLMSFCNVQDWKILGSPGYPEDTTWQASFIARFILRFLLLLVLLLLLLIPPSFLPLLSCLPFSTERFGPLRSSLYIHNSLQLQAWKPRDELNRPQEPRTFASFQLPLRPPYVWGTICKQYDWPDAAPTAGFKYYKGAWCVAEQIAGSAGTGVEGS